jgi:hypothetical protein
MDIEPILLGIVGAVLIILLVNLALALFLSPVHGRWATGTLFAACAVALTLGALRSDLGWWRFACAVAAAFFGYAALAATFEWPGFRPPAADEDDPA